MSRSQRRKISRPAAKSTAERSSRLEVSLLSGAVIGVAAMAAPAAMASTFVVNNTGDDGNTTGTLRWAVEQANENPGPDVINFDPSMAGKTILLSNGNVQVLDSVTINGPTSQNTVVDAQKESRVFYIYDHTHGAVMINHLTVANGKDAGTGYAGGGGIVGWSGDLTLDHVTVENNASYYVESGAPVHAASVHQHTPVHDEFTVAGQSHGKGGGVAKFGTGSLTITNSTISGNRSNVVGGGIFVGYAAFSITNSQVVNNYTAGDGGGIALYDPAYAATIVQTLVSGNSANIADGNGGGLAERYSDGGTVSIDRSTFVNNSAYTVGGGLAIGYVNDAVTLTNSTVAYNYADDNADGIFVQYAPAGTGVNFTTVANNGSFSLDNRRNDVHAARRARTSAPSGGIAGGIVVEGAAGTTLSGSKATTDGVTKLAGFLIDNSVLDHNIVADIAGGPFTISHSFVGNTDAASYTNAGGNVLNTGTANLGPLTNNGGPAVGDPGGDIPLVIEPTMMPGTGSPAINTADPAGAPPIDERTYGRTDGQPDMGAVEVNGVPPVEVPALGTFAKLALALTTMITGLFMAGRKKFLGVLLVGTLAALVAGTSLHAQALQHRGAHAHTLAKVERMRGTLDSMSVRNGQLLLSVNGKAITLPQNAVRIVDARSRRRQVVSTEVLHSGARVFVTVRRAPDGSVRMARVRIVNASLTR